ncbi:AAA family ATPase [Streptacidiphilus sp. N1-10]|uniref:AAA family ATPase n=1 Tax=Streptacidiphilus jeojiensis TaxID=3229225 RepID=A0ABV6XYW6_9ACTN
MYLARVTAENFRIYGAKPLPPKTSEEPAEPDSSLDVTFRSGLSVLVGENDSGKSAIIDAIRLCLTSSADFYRVTAEDFHCGPEGPAASLTIRSQFCDLSAEEAGTFAEFLTHAPGQDPSLWITLHAETMDPARPHRVSVTIRAGQVALDGAARELLRATYLRPLRDAEGEMRAGRNSRLSQILTLYPNMEAQSESDFDAEGDTASTLVGILRRAEHHINDNDLVRRAKDTINDDYLSKFAIGADTLASAIGVATSASLQHALERLELTFAPEAGRSLATRRGLGYNNALFMAAELLLLGKQGFSPLLLIEEPEAHLHPQLQTRVVDLLVERSRDDRPVQVIVTTHSPHIASAVSVDHLSLVSSGTVFSLEPQHTKLDASDYAFLSRFLDVTKANLFFARAVAIVEGDAEAVLLPTLALCTRRSFTQSGVSIVNVGTVGLFRYSRIFQRTDGRTVPVRVACITDLDVAPVKADEAMRGKLPSRKEMSPSEVAARAADRRHRDGGSVRTFVSDQWTLEYDLAASSWTMATVMHQAVTAAGKSSWPTEQDLVVIDDIAAKQVETWRLEGQDLEDVALQIYRPLRIGRVRKPIAAQHAARLLEGRELPEADLPRYLVDAFDYLCGAPKP